MYETADDDDESELFDDHKKRGKKVNIFLKKKIISNHFGAICREQQTQNESSFFFGEHKVLKYMYLFMPEMRFRIEFLTKFEFPQLQLCVADFFFANVH